MEEAKRRRRVVLVAGGGCICRHFPLISSHLLFLATVLLPSFFDAVLPTMDEQPQQPQQPQQQPAAAGTGWALLCKRLCWGCCARLLRGCQFCSWPVDSQLFGFCWPRMTPLFPFFLSSSFFLFFFSFLFFSCPKVKIGASCSKHSKPKNINNLLFKARQTLEKKREKGKKG